MLGMLACGLVLAGCSGATPLCNQAGTLLAQGRPADAMALYARASDQEEGNCASDGLTRAGEQIGRAAREEARGAAAELAGDVAGATAGYQAALQLNNGDARAAAGLVRLGQQVGTPPPAEIPPLPPSTEPPSWWRSPWPLLIGAVLLVAALAAAGYALVRHEALRRKLSDVQAAAESPIMAPAPDQSAVNALQERTDAAADVLAERCAALEDALARLDASGARRDRLLELLAGQLSGPAAGGVQREQLFAAPPQPAETTGEGSGVVDVTLVGVETADGSRRTVVQRVRWTPPDDAAATALAGQIGSDPVTILDVLGTGSVTPAWAHSTELWLLPAATGLTAEVGSDGALATLVGGGAVRSGELSELTADMAGLVAAGSPLTFLAQLVTVVVGGAWTCASLTSEAHDAASGIAATALEAAAGLTGPVWAGTSGRTPGPPAELTRLLGRAGPERAEERLSAPVVVHVVADLLDEDGDRPAGPHSAWRIERFAVDVEGVLLALNRTATEAARRLSEHPADGVAIEAFRGALRPAPAAPDRTHTEHPVTVAVPIGATTIACDVLAIGDRQHPVDFAYRVATTRLDLARMLKDSAALTRAFAEQLNAVRTGRTSRAFDAALRGAVGPEQLGPIVTALPGRTPRLTIGPESIGAVESTYTPAGIDAAQPAEPEAEPVRQGAQMYDALRMRSGALVAAPPVPVAPGPPPAPEPEFEPVAGSVEPAAVVERAATPRRRRTEPDRGYADDSRAYRGTGRGYDEPDHPYDEPERAHDDVTGRSPGHSARDNNGSRTRGVE